MGERKNIKHLLDKFYRKYIFPEYRSDIAAYETIGVGWAYTRKPSMNEENICVSFTMDLAFYLIVV